MYKVWPKQCPVLIEEYIQIYENLTKTASSPSDRKLALHFQQLFDQYDLSLLSEEQQQECLSLVTKIRAELGMIKYDTEEERHMVEASEKTSINQ